MAGCGWRLHSSKPVSAHAMQAVVLQLLSPQTPSVAAAATIPFPIAPHRAILPAPLQYVVLSSSSSSCCRLRPEAYRRHGPLLRLLLLLWGFGMPALTSLEVMHAFTPAPSSVRDAEQCLLGTSSCAACISSARAAGVSSAMAGPRRCQLYLVAAGGG